MFYTCHYFFPKINEIPSEDNQEKSSLRTCHELLDKVLNDCELPDAVKHKYRILVSIHLSAT